MRPRSTTELARIHEHYIADLFGGKRSAASGSKAHSPIDVTTPDYVIECEATESKSLSVKLATWLEVRGKVYDGKVPIYALRFAPPGLRPTDLIALDPDDFLEIKEKADRYDGLG